MSDPEGKVNAALSRLGEEFRLGMIQAEEYRTRRRELFDSWGDRDVTTAPGSVTQREKRPRAEAAPAVPAAGRSRHLVAGAAGAVIVAGLAYAASLFLRPAAPPAPRPAPVLPAVVATPPQVLAAQAAADRFLAEDRWGDGEISAFLAQWRALSDEERERARREPSLRSLSHELEQNIRAAEALGPEPGSAEQEHLERLAAFARELDGEGS